VSPTEVLDAVAAEVGRLLDADWAGVHRHEPDGAATVLASRGEGALHALVGTRIPLRDESVIASVARTGRTALMSSFEDAPGSLAARARELGVRSAIGAPITVEGRLWGVMVAAWTQQEPLPADDAQSRMAAFTELVATAIANAESRTELSVRSEEQAALRRVATLVARGVSPTEVLDAVAAEVGRLFDADWPAVSRYEPDGTLTILSARGTNSLDNPVGTRAPLDGESVAGAVKRTGRSARMESYVGATGSLAARARELGIRFSVGAPITVEGRLWGVMTAAWTREEPPPEDTEGRMANFTELVGTAIANAESRAELGASRARVIAATAEERQRVVRDLHDGAQQRLVHAVINLKLGLRELEHGDKHTQEFLTEALDHAEQANSELRELAHGIMPGVLTSGGLRGGVDELVSRSSLPVTMDVSTERLPPAIEATAYFVVSEALTNAVKHSGAQRVEVRAEDDNGVLRVEIRDDGVGGADPGQGSGLTGLRDRVEALGGRIEIASPAGSGTSVLVEIPLESG
jgi:signal transduction histidine kinase